jgi:predicted nucleic-acid-binding protein
LTSKDIILDTNAVLRFIIGDDTERLQKVIELLDTVDCIVPIEVVVEVVYNMVKYYGHTRNIIADKIKDFISIKEDLVEKENVVRYGCNVYASTSLDFVDCMLLAYANVNGNSVFSFDDPLNKKLEHNAFNQRKC